MSIKRMYLEGDDFTPLVQWLRTRPQGICKVLIRSLESPLQNLAAELEREDRALKVWVINKIRLGELDISTTPDAISSFPVGEVVETD
jgi:hypothetical protein